MGVPNPVVRDPQASTDPGALPRPYYQSVFEPGCAIGLLTRELAARSGRVLAMDISAAALQQGQAGPPENVEYRRGSVPTDWPSGSFDLVLVSELGYYLDEEECRQLADLAASTALDLVAVHWRHHVEGYPLTGDHVHNLLAAAPLTQLCRHDEKDFRLAVWSHDSHSVAQRTGLIPQ